MGRPSDQKILSKNSGGLYADSRKGYKTDFNIVLSFKDFPVEGYENQTTPVEPFPIMDVFDYRISGEISDSGSAKLIFENGTVTIPAENISINIPLEDGAKYCGKLKLILKFTTESRIQ